MRGATLATEFTGLQLLVSIHAPRAGRDEEGLLQLPLSAVFQSPRPVRGATAAAHERQHLVDVSIHAPRAGRDIVALILFRWR